MKFGSDLGLFKIAKTAISMSILPARVPSYVPHGAWSLERMIPPATQPTTNCGYMYNRCNVLYAMPRIVLFGGWNVRTATLLFSCEVSVMKYVACIPGYLEAIVVWGTRRFAPRAAYAARCTRSGRKSTSNYYSVIYFWLRRIRNLTSFVDGARATAVTFG